MVIGRWAAALLGVVFVVAGASKVASGPQWPVQAAGLGAPRRIAPLVPWWELAVGAALVTGLAWQWAAAAALATLLVFTALLVRVLRSGARPACACFGAWSAAPVGWRHVARNAAFGALAVVALAA